MKEKLPLIIAIFAAVAAVSAGSLAVHFRGVAEAALQKNINLALQLETAQAVKAVPAVAPPPNTHALEAEIKSLRSQLDKQKTPVVEEDQEAEVTPATPLSPGERGNWMEQLKESDPERYRQIQERMDGMRKNVTDAVARQAAFNLNVDPSNMTDEQRANHEALLAKLESMMEMSDKLKNSGEGIDMRQVGMQMGETFRDLNVLYENQRTMLLEDLGKKVGYEGEQAAEFSGYVQEIYDMTSPRSLFRGMMPMGGGGRRGNP